MFTAVYTFLVICAWQRIEKYALPRGKTRPNDQTQIYPLSGVRFIQLNGGGFFLEVKGRQWVDCYFHMNLNKKIRIDDYGQYWGPLYPGQGNLSRWATFSRRPLINDSDIACIRLDAREYDFSTTKLFIPPFTASIHADLAANISVTKEIYSN